MPTTTTVANLLRALAKAIVLVMAFNVGCTSQEACESNVAESRTHDERHTFTVPTTRTVRTDQPEYSPFLGDYPDRVFFCDTHLHTSFSAGFAGTVWKPRRATSASSSS